MKNNAMYEMIKKTSVFKLSKFKYRNCADIYMDFEKFNLSSIKKDRMFKSESLIIDTIYNYISDVNYIVISLNISIELMEILMKVKEKFENVKYILVEELDVPILVDGVGGVHKVDYIESHIIDNNYLSMFDELYSISSEEASDISNVFKRKEGILIENSTGASIAVAINISKQIGIGKKILVIPSYD